MTDFKSSWFLSSWSIFTLNAKNGKKIVQYDLIAPSSHQVNSPWIAVILVRMQFYVFPEWVITSPPQPSLIGFLCILDIIPNLSNNHSLFSLILQTRSLIPIYWNWWTVRKSAKISWQNQLILYRELFHKILNYNDECRCLITVWSWNAYIHIHFSQCEDLRAHLSSTAQRLKSQHFY